MKKSIVGLGVLVLAVIISVNFWGYSSNTTEEYSSEKLLTEVEENPVKVKKGRAEYFNRLLRDPATNRIPKNIRSRELDYSKNLPSRSGNLLRVKPASSSSSGSVDVSWQSAGPEGLGGRTRALGIDQRDPNIILAGGVSGGVWKSTDGGSTWALKTSPNQNMSVTSLTQDPTDPDTWYYASGEDRGNSASDRGFTAFYFGSGIYKSTDNGETWSLLPATQGDLISYDTPWDLVSKIDVSTSGSIFIATNNLGLYRSTDDGNTFEAVLGENEHDWIGFDIDSQGNIIAVLSSSGASASATPGVFYSDDDGGSWAEITPSGFPGSHSRSVVSFAPSAPDSAYIFSQKLNSDTNQGVSFFRLNLADTTAEDRSANIPDFGNPVGGMNTQGSYNMVVSVKPDDPDFVLVGGTNLYRSRDGFRTAPSSSSTSEKEEYWVGGYARANNVSQYAGQHPDQHVIAWDPTDPNKVWSGHDGGLSITSDVTAVPLTWQDTDDGYVTGQFYTVAIGPDAGGKQVVGGTQDNGSPAYTVDDQNMEDDFLGDASSGDGAYAHIGHDNIYTSSQRGRLLKWNKSFSSLDYLEPMNAQNQLFIHPYVVDPNDDGIIYYPGGQELWRNTIADEITNSNPSGTTEGWNELSNAAISGYNISALAVSTSPADILYYAGSNSTDEPVIKRLDNASTSTDAPTDISIPSAPSGAYVHNIAVNPSDGDEAIVVMSNYNIVGLYHTTDGGSSWTAIEGNLEGDANNPGPSIRNATILPTAAGTIYFVGTSTGTYSTTSFSGSNTSWTRESDDGSPGSIGYSISEYIVSRPADGKVAVATHGRGIFMADVTVNQTGDGQVPAAPTNVVATTDGGDVSVSWDANSETDISEYIIYRGTDSDNLQQYDTVNAALQSFTDSNADGKSFYYAVTAFDVEGNESDQSAQTAVYKKIYTISSDWQLIGFPITAKVDINGGKVFSFNGAYKSTSSVQSNEGVWVKSSTTMEVNGSGEAATSATIPLKKGWNMISGIVDTIAASSIQDPGGILSSADIYRYSSGSYQIASEIRPEEGYWIHTNQSGDITLSINGSGSSKESSPNRPLTDRITFRCGQATQQFYMARSRVDKEAKEIYRMPPQAPEPNLDVRTNDGFRVASSKSTEIKLTTKNYPVTIGLSAHASSEYILKGVTGRDTVMYKLMPGKKESIQRPYEKWFLDGATEGMDITEHNLLPNYPNPFNPTTNIRYELASQADVTIQIYDVLGRKVQTLVNRSQQAGRYEVPFNGKNLSSGVYFIHLKTKNRTRIQKMTLLK